MPLSELVKESGKSSHLIRKVLKQLLSNRIILTTLYGKITYYKLNQNSNFLLSIDIEKLSKRFTSKSHVIGIDLFKFRNARVCYNHMAGRIGMKFFQSLLQQGYITGHGGSFSPKVFIESLLKTPTVRLWMEYSLNRGVEWHDEIEEAESLCLSVRVSPGICYEVPTQGI